MRVLLQRVSRASVRVDGKTIGAIERGYCLLVGLTTTDTDAQCVWMADKIVGLRLFGDAEGKMNLETDALKIVLTNTAPSAGNSVFGDLTEISGGNGYTSGGNAITIASSGQTSGTYKLVLDDLTITASGGSIGPASHRVSVTAM